MLYLSQLMLVPLNGQTWHLTVIFHFTGVFLFSTFFGLHIGTSCPPTCVLHMDIFTPFYTYTFTP